jgi:hypothetical protein
VLHHYPGDVDRKRVELIRFLPESARRQTKPPASNLYHRFCRLMSVGRWRTAPMAFPDWNSACAAFGKWSAQLKGTPFRAPGSRPASGPVRGSADIGLPWHSSMQPV